MIRGRNKAVTKGLFVAWLFVVCSTFGPVASAQSVDELLSQANSLFKQGLTEQTRQVHEKIIKLDTACIESNRWLGNYYYLKGEDKRKQAEEAYRVLPFPSSMQSAFYQEQLKTICCEYYLRADTLVQRVLRKQPNDYLQSIAAGIEAYKIKLGLAKPPVKKKTSVLNVLKLNRKDSVAP